MYHRACTCGEDAAVGDAAGERAHFILLEKLSASKTVPAPSAAFFFGGGFIPSCPKRSLPHMNTFPSTWSKPQKIGQLRQSDASHSERAGAQGWSVGPGPALMQPEWFPPAAQLAILAAPPSPARWIVSRRGPRTQPAQQAGAVSRAGAVG